MISFFCKYDIFLDAKYYLREPPPDRRINRKYSAAQWLQARGKEEANEAEKRRGIIHSELKREGGGKNGSPGGLRGQIQAEGMVSSAAIAALFCFHSSEKLPDAPPEGTPGMKRETEKGH